MDAATLKAGDKVREVGGVKVWRIVRLVSVFGIPTADLIHVRKDGADGILRGRNYHNRPLSVLERVGGQR